MTQGQIHTGARFCVTSKLAHCGRSKYRSPDPASLISWIMWHRVCKFFAKFAKGESQVATQNHYSGLFRIRDQKFTTIQGAAFNSNGIGSKVWAGSLLSIQFEAKGILAQRVFTLRALSTFPCKGAELWKTQIWEISPGAHALFGPGPEPGLVFRPINLSRKGAKQTGLVPWPGQLVPRVGQGHK